MKINVFKILNKTTAEGPGKRFCLWVQGCSRHCSGCHAKATWSHSVNKLMDVEEVFALIKQQKDIEGVTFLGGEPFEQAQALGMLAQKIQGTGLSVMTFSGNTYENLKSSKDIHVQNLLKYTDLLADGEFIENEFDLSRPWIGSKNQRYVFLSGRYSQEDVMQYKNKIELRIDKNGAVFVNGMANFKQLKECLAKNHKIPEKNYAC